MEDAGQADGGVDAGPPGPIYDTVPACDDAALWELEPTVPVGSRDWYGVETAGEARSELPYVSYSGLNLWGIRQACVRALDDHGGFVEGDVRELAVDADGSARVYFFRSVSDGVAPRVETRTFGAGGWLTGQRIRLGAVEPHPIVELEAPPRGMALTGDGSGGDHDGFRWATGEGVYDTRSAWTGPPEVAIPGLLRWVPRVWTTDGTLSVRGTDHAVPDVTAETQVFAFQRAGDLGSPGSGAGVVLDGELLLFPDGDADDRLHVRLPPEALRVEVVEPRGTRTGAVGPAAILAVAEDGLHAWAAETGEPLLVAERLQAEDLVLLRGSTALLLGQSLPWALTGDRLFALTTEGGRVDVAHEYDVEDLGAVGRPIAAIAHELEYRSPSPVVLVLGDRGMARALRPGIETFGPASGAYPFDGAVRDVVVAHTLSGGSAALFLVETRDGSYRLRPAFDGPIHSPD